MRRGNPAFFTFIFIFISQKSSFTVRIKDFWIATPAFGKRGEDGSDNVFSTILNCEVWVISQYDSP